MTPDKKSSAAENFSMKFSRRIKNATPAVTSSPIAPVTLIFRYGDGLAHRPKMWCSHQENKPVVISHFIFCPSFTICIFDFSSLPLSSTIFIYSFSTACLFHHCIIEKQSLSVPEPGKSQSVRRRWSCLGQGKPATGTKPGVAIEPRTPAQRNEDSQIQMLLGRTMNTAQHK
jgi:hypothetical protein